MKHRVIVYEKLSFFTFCFSFIVRNYFEKQYFIDFDPFFKKHFSSVIKRLGLKQVHRICFRGRPGIENMTEELAVEMGNRIMLDNPYFATPLINYFRDERAESVIKSSITRSLLKDAYKYAVLKEFASVNSDNLVYYFSNGKKIIFYVVENILSNIIVIRWCFIWFSIKRFFKNLFYFGALIIAPFYLFFRLIYEKRLVYRNNKNKICKKAIFFHRYPDLNVENDTHALYKNMDFLNNGIMEIGDCVHMCFIKSFSKKKSDYLRKKGGEVLNYNDQKVLLTRARKRLFVDFYKYFFPYFYMFSFNSLSFDVIKNIMSFIFKGLIFESLLENICARLAFFEAGLIFHPANGLFTIIANRYNIKTMAGVNGYGPYCYNNCKHANSVINHCLVPGNYYNRYMKRNNPHIDKFHAIGDYEIESTTGNSFPSLECLKKGNRKIVGILFNFYGFFFPEAQKKWPVFDYEDARKVFLYYWQPFFRWAGRQDNLFFIFKGKTGTKQYEHPFLKEVISEISRDRYYQEDDMLMKDVILASDYTICGGDGNTSAFYGSLCLGVPSISYDISTIGYVAAERENYNSYIVTHKPEELITDFQHILKNGLPEEVFERVRRDHHAEGKLDNQTSLRIKRAISEVTEGR